MSEAGKRYARKPKSILVKDVIYYAELEDNLKKRTHEDERKIIQLNAELGRLKALNMFHQHIITECLKAIKI